MSTSYSLIRMSTFHYWISVGLFAILTLVCMLIAHRRGDGTMVKGLQSTWSMFRETWLLLLVAWLFAGYMAVLIPRELVEQWLGRESGWWGIALACAAGALTPGGLLVALPIVLVLRQAGAAPSVLVTYFAACALYAFARLPFEFTFLGARLTAIRWASTCIFPPLAGIIAKVMFER